MTAERVEREHLENEQEHIPTAEAKDRALALLAEGWTLAQVAADPDVGRARVTIYRWVNYDEQFKRKLSIARVNNLEQALRHAEAEAPECIRIAMEIAKDSDRQDFARLQAAKLVLEFAIKTRLEAERIKHGIEEQLEAEQQQQELPEELLNLDDASIASLLSAVRGAEKTPGPGPLRDVSPSQEPAGPEDDD